MAVRLENRCVVFANPDPYCPPELTSQILKGNVYGHPKHADGNYIKTSAIKEVKGRNVVTHSGTEYILGEVDHEYSQWVMATMGRSIDPDNPIKVRS